MKTGFKHAIALLTMLVAVITTAEPAKVDSGKTENGVFTNSYFGVTMQIPKDWNVSTSEQRKKSEEAGKKIIAGDSKRLKDALDNVDPNIVKMLHVSKHPIGAPVDFNPNIGMGAENVSLLPGIKRGSDYLFHIKKLLKSSAIKPEFAEKTYALKVGDIEMDVLDAVLKVADKTVKQRYYVGIVKGYALYIVGTYDDDSEGDFINEVVKGMSIKPK